MEIEIFLLVLVFLMGKACAVSSVLFDWANSRLGTSKYNQELNAIAFGKDDRMKIESVRTTFKPHPLLCTSFVSSTPSPTVENVLSENIRIMGDKCHWALIFYDNDESQIAKRCSGLPNLIHCQAIPNYLRHNGTDAYGAKLLSVSKTVLYTELLPFLPLYERVFLMDEDISLVGFNISTFTAMWDCSFGSTPPLIVQPLIVESKQNMQYVNAKGWENDTDVWASEVGYIEQQVPLIDSIFFEWFVRRVLSITFKASVKHGVDWHDRTWCNAAKTYSTMVLGQESSTVVCAVFPKAPMVHHLDGKTLMEKRSQLNHFRFKGGRMVTHYINMFPTWTLLDILYYPNPLRPENRLKYRRLNNVSSSCLEKHR